MSSTAIDVEAYDRAHVVLSVLSRGSLVAPSRSAARDALLAAGFTARALLAVRTAEFYDGCVLWAPALVQDPARAGELVEIRSVLRLTSSPP